MIPPLCASLFIAVTLCISGCATTSDSAHSEFVKTVNFSNLDTFHYEHTLIAGMSFRKSEEILLENLSEQVLQEAFTTRGFESVESSGDFFIVAKWRKAVSTYVNTFSPIDGPAATIGRGNESATLARVSLVVEIYESSSGNLFWRKDMPNAFDAIQFTQDRITRTLQEAVRHFPDRIEKDPNLPTIQ